MITPILTKNQAKILRRALVAFDAADKERGYDVYPEVAKILNELEIALGPIGMKGVTR